MEEIEAETEIKSEKNITEDWNLDDILTTEEFDSVYREIQNALPEFDEWYKKLNPRMDIEKFREMIEFTESVKEKLSRISWLPELMICSSQNSQTAQLLKKRAENLESMHSEAEEKIEQWLGGKKIKNKEWLDKRNSKRLFKAIPDLEYYLTGLRGQGFLSENEEYLFAKKESTWVSALSRLRASIESGQKYSFQPNGAEKPKRFTHNEFISFKEYLGCGEKIKEFDRAYFAEYKKNMSKYFDIFQVIADSLKTEAELRGYESSFSMVNESNGISDRIIRSLFKRRNENKSIMERYFKILAKDRKLEKLTWTDVSRITPTKGYEKVLFNDGLELILKSFKSFCPRFSWEARKIIEMKHIDYSLRQNKKDDGFCISVNNKIVPYIFINYKGYFNDLSDLAHEFGHGIHSLYSNQHSISSEDCPFILGEVPSILSEIILLDELCKNSEGEIKKSLLLRRMYDVFMNVFYQSFLSEFEINAHKAINNGISAEEFSDIYINSLKEFTGKNIETDDFYKYNWTVKNHFIERPFSLSLYSVDYLISASLFSQYKQEGKSFVPKIEKILSAGGTRDPTELLKEVGINLNSKKFWDNSFGIINEWQKELEEVYK